MAQPSKAQNKLTDEFKRIKIVGNFRKEDFTDELIDYGIKDVRFRDGGELHRVLFMKWKSGPDLELLVPKKKDSKEYSDPEAVPGYTDVGKLLDRIEAKGIAVYGMPEFRGLKMEPDIRGSTFTMKIKITNKTGGAAQAGEEGTFTNWECENIELAKSPAASGVAMLSDSTETKGGSKGSAPKAPASAITRKEVQDICMKALGMMPEGEWATKIDLQTNMVAVMSEMGLTTADKTQANTLREEAMDILTTAGVVLADVGASGAPLYKVA